MSLALHGWNTSLHLQKDLWPSALQPPGLPLVQLRMVTVFLMISASESSSILISLGWRIGSCGSTFVVEVGSCVSAPFPMYFVSSFGRLVLSLVGSCMTTVGSVTREVVCVTGDKDIDVDDEGILVTSISFPLPLCLRAGSYLLKCGHCYHLPPGKFLWFCSFAWYICSW